MLESGGIAEDTVAHLCLHLHQPPFVIDAAKACCQHLGVEVVLTTNIGKDDAATGSLVSQSFTEIHIP